MKTLFILPNAIGDVIAGLPSAESLSRNEQFVWLVNRNSVPIVRAAGYETLVPPGAEIRRRGEFGASLVQSRALVIDFLRRLSQRGPFHRVVNPHLSRSACLLAGAVEADERAGPAIRPLPDPALEFGPLDTIISSIAKSPYTPDLMLSDPWSDFFLGSIVGATSPELSAYRRFAAISRVRNPSPPRLPLPGSPSREKIVLQSGAGWPSKALPPEEAARIADALSSLGPVVPIGSPEEEPDLRRIRDLAEKSLLPFRPGPLERALEEIAEAALVVTTDSWALHAAAALQRPVLVLLGSTRVFPACEPSFGLALSPPGWGSWNPEATAECPRFRGEDITAAARALLENETPPSFSNPDGPILWRARTDGFAEPSRPPFSNTASAAEHLYRWARARAFDSLCRKLAPDRTVPIAFRSKESLKAFLKPFPKEKIRAAARTRIRETDFPLFPTTFPGQDAGEIAREWLRRTMREIEI